MSGLMQNFNVEESAIKDKLAQDFIKTVNPYRSKPSLGIDLRKLAKFARENNSSGVFSASELQKFKMN